MVRGWARLRRWGLRLALLALAFQAAIPLLILGDLRALAAEEAADRITGSSLCIHDGSQQPDHAPSHQCCFSVCPLCAALAAATAIAPSGHALPVPAFAGRARFPVLAAAERSHEARPRPYQSRAPPLA